MRSAAIGGTAGLAIATMLAHAAGAQGGSLVSPSSTLPARVALRSTAVAVSVTLTRPAVLVPLGYHEERGWYLLASFASLPVREAGEQTLTFARRLGRMDVPAGTSVGSVPNVPDAGLGCATAGGVHNPTSGHCGVGGSEYIAPILDVAIGAGDYRGALLRLTPGLSAAALDSALLATRGRQPAEALSQLARRLAQRDSAAAWALVRVPRGS